MKLKVRPGDLVAGVAMVAVLGAGGVLTLGGGIGGAADSSAPSSESTSVAPSAEPSPTDDAAAEKRKKSKDSANGQKDRTRPSTGSAAGTKKIITYAKSPVVVQPGSKPAVGARMADLSLQVASFNVLGSSHTTGRGAKGGFASGPTRAGYAAQLIAARGSDVIGLQELQANQMARITGSLPDYAIYPGRALTWREGENSIMWRNDVWKLVDKFLVSIPYFRGSARRMPIIRLQHRESRAEIWVANFHNPADTPRFGNNSRWRKEAIRRQVALVNELRAKSDTPVILTGDFNDRAEAFCPLVGSTDLRASNGGSADGGCAPPARMDVDWVFGTDDVQWTDHVSDRSSAVRRATDHPLVVATGQLQLAYAPKVKTGNIRDILAAARACKRDESACGSGT